MKYGKEELTIAIKEYMGNVNTIDTQIGNYSNTSKDLIKTGIQLNNTQPMIDILGKIDVPVEFCDFKTTYNKEIITKILKDEGNSYLSDCLSAILSNKKLIMPFSLSDEVYVQGAKLVVNMIKSSVINGKRDITLKFEPTTKDTRVYPIIVRLSDYGTEFSVTPTLTDKLGLIQYSGFGYVRPIELIDDGFSIIIDGTYVYMVKDKTEYRVGEWKNNKIVLEEFNIVTKSKQVKVIGKYIKLITEHRKQIAPYNLAQTNKIKKLS